MKLLCNDFIVKSAIQIILNWTKKESKMTWQMNSWRSLRIRGERLHDDQRYEDEVKRVSTPAQTLQKNTFNLEDKPYKRDQRVWMCLTVYMRKMNTNDCVRQVLASVSVQRVLTHSWGLVPVPPQATAETQPERDSSKSSSMTCTTVVQKTKTNIKKHFF